MMIQVVIMDLLCMVPYYNKYLVRALKNQNVNVKLASISFHLDLKLFSLSKIKNDPGLFDLVSKMKIKTPRSRRILKGFEYCINMLAYSIRFLFVKPDILHLQWLPMVQRTSIEFLFIKWVKLIGVKIVYTVHNILPHDTGNKYIEKYKQLYKLPNALICHTKETKKMLIENFAVRNENIWVIPHGSMFHDYERIDTGRARRELNLNVDDIIVLCFGIIRPYKGIEFLLKSWVKVINKCPNARLIIAGGGETPYLNKVRDLISELGLQNHVESQFSFIPSDRLPLYFTASDILVYPYQYVTQSGALLTGMSFGKPIVATYTGGFKETLDNGLDSILIEYGNEGQLSEALARLIENPDLRNKLGLAILEKLNINYSWDHVAGETVSWYDHLLNKL